MEPIIPAIIQIALRQYFCNISHLDEIESLSYFYSLQSEIIKNSEVTWEDLPNYIVFDTASPALVLQYMLDLYQDIVETLKIHSPNITINSLELASSLSESFVKNYYVNKEYLIEESNGDIRYSEEAQILFNEKYSESLEKINEARVL